MSIITILFGTSLLALLGLLGVKGYEQSYGSSLIPKSIRLHGERYAQKAHHAFHRLISFINRKTALLLWRLVRTQLSWVFSIIRQYAKTVVREVTGTQKQLRKGGHSSSFLHKVTAHKRENGGGSLDEE